MMNELREDAQMTANGKAQYFYVHRKGTFTGNAPSFWAKGGNGYTCYVLNAERFSAEDAYKLYKEDPTKWELFDCDAVDKRLHLVFDIQDKKRLGTDLPCPDNRVYAQMTAQIEGSRVELKQIHEIVMSIEECPPVEESDTYLVKAVKGMAYMINKDKAQSVEPVAWRLKDPNSKTRFYYEKVNKEGTLFELMELLHTRPDPRIAEQNYKRAVFESLIIAIQHAKVSSNPFEFLCNQIEAMDKTEFTAPTPTPSKVAELEGRLREAREALGRIFIMWQKTKP